MQKTKIFLPKPTWCGICKKFITGITASMQDAATCTSCKLVAHRTCCAKDNKCGTVPVAPTQPPASNVKAIAEVLYDFPPENERELKLTRGDKVEVFQVSGEWWYGAIVLQNGQHGNEGFFPGTYVQKIGQWELEPNE